MSETGPSEWAPPAESTPKTPQQLLNERYSDRNNPDDLDDMVVLPGEMITVPDWSAVEDDEPVESGAEDDPFSKGKEIIIERSAKIDNETKQIITPAYNDGGWKIFDDNAVKETKKGSGQYLAAVKVEKIIDGKLWEKTVFLSDVMKLNSQEVAKTPESAEKAPLSEAQEDLAEEAIEDAIGVSDPSEVDGNAQMLNIKEMRAAAERVIDAPVASDVTPETPTVEAPSAAETEQASLEKEITELHESLNKMVEDLSVNDRTAVWQYAAAINYTESHYAEQKLSYGFAQKNPGLLQKYHDDFKKLQELRVKARTFEK